MVSSLGLDSFASASPVAPTKPLVEGDSPRSGSTSLEKKCRQFANEQIALHMQQQLQLEIAPLLARISLLEKQLATRTRGEDVFFNAAEMQAIMFNLAPEKVTMWLDVFFMPAVQYKNPLAHEIVSYSDAQWEAAKAEPINVVATQWLARAVKSALIRGEPHVERFYNSLLCDDKKAIISCGRALVLEIRNKPVFEVGAEQDTAERSLETYPYFEAGKSVAELKLKASQFKGDYALLAEQGVVGGAEITLFYKMIDRMPESCEAYKADLKQQLRTHPGARRIALDERLRRRDRRGRGEGIET